jgi:hypothetical protein|tara:strand:+ start:15798 stop:15977 length:180 start_codon:yes stop_codon:yes gene_type:complete
MMDIKDIKLGDILKVVIPFSHVDNGFVGTVVGFESGYARLLGDGYDTGILFSPTFLAKV